MKEIEEKFILKLGYKNESSVCITARNCGTHLLDVSRNALPVTIKEMKSIAKHLVRTAGIIEADKDFNNIS